MSDKKLKERRNDRCAPGLTPVNRFFPDSLGYSDMKDLGRLFATHLRNTVFFSTKYSVYPMDSFQEYKLFLRTNLHQCAGRR